MNENQVVAALSALSQETRLRMVRYLVTKGGEGAAAGEVAKAAGASSSRASFHLNALSQAGLITATRASRSIIYRVDFAAMGGLIGYLIEDCCQNDPTIVSCCAPLTKQQG
ncbi:MAG: helix-turn-helix transcriptional regulator [Paracoccaceae bacterium]|jgi:DNA-binding transcriptional ArsR family regulator|nr:helix-turn-helix transcriptional regulator [Paracoccaceae bacterium]